uniref:SFRICE_029087 n=1 Tax=Spodoptera frugiperda TaxID=7108 RepID=A0A2H1WIG5_SPOFR
METNLEIKHLRYMFFVVNTLTSILITFNSINVKVCLFRCLYVNHAEITERILMKCSIQTTYELTWVIMLFIEPCHE